MGPVSPRRATSPSAASAAGMTSRSSSTGSTSNPENSPTDSSDDDEAADAEEPDPPAPPAPPEALLPPLPPAPLAENEDEDRLPRPRAEDSSPPAGPSAPSSRSRLSARNVRRGDSARWHCTPRPRPPAALARALCSARTCDATRRMRCGSGREIYSTESHDAAMPAGSVGSSSVSSVSTRCERKDATPSTTTRRRAGSRSGSRTSTMEPSSCREATGSGCEEQMMKAIPAYYTSFTQIRDGSHTVSNKLVSSRHASSRRAPRLTGADRSLDGVVTRSPLAATVDISVISQDLAR